jgi:hypothetical protein
MSSRAIAVLLLLSLAAFSSWAQSTPATGGTAPPAAAGTAAEAGAGAAAGAPAAPADDQPDWLVGVAAFSGQGLSPDNLYLLSSIPLLLRQNMETIRTHYFTAEEKVGYRQAVIRRAERKQGEQLETLRRERDALFFKETDPAALAAKRSEYDQKIRRASEALNGLRSMSPEAVVFPDSKPVRFASGEKEQALLDAPLHSPLDEALRVPVNLLVWGRLEEIQGFLYFEVHALDSALQSETYFYSDAVSRDELPAVVGQVSQELERQAWGRDWASLTVQAAPGGASIYLDGTLVGTGQARLDFVLPGEREVRIELDGYQTEVRRVSLQPYSLFELAVELEKEERAPRLLSSAPAGAVVYSGSTRLGETPLSIFEPDSPTRFLLRKEGYRDQALYLGGGAKQRLEVPLIPDSIDPVKLQNRARNRFYTAFGIFALSVPIPFFCWAILGDYVVGYQLASPSEQDRMRRISNGLYWSTWGTLGLSIGLAVNMVIQLVRYVRTADRRG